MAVRTVTLQTHIVRARPKWTFSNAVKEIDRERDSGQPDIPGLMQDRDDSGNLVGGCSSALCPEDIYPILFEGFDAGEMVVGDAVVSGSDFKTPAKSRSIQEVWYDDLLAVKDTHYTTPDPDTITPTVPLSPGTEVKVRFRAY